jgi:uncharacterized membrane protein
MGEHLWLFLIPLILLAPFIGFALGAASRRADKW